MPNPFIVGRPVPAENFVGRKSEITIAFDQIYNRSHLAIWGSPGMGKSSFLQKLESPQTWEKYGLEPSKAVIVRFSCESIIPFTPSRFWKEILICLKGQFENEPRLQEKIEKLLERKEVNKDSLREILRFIARNKKFLVLLLDDYDLALQTNEEYDEHAMQKFLSECRNLAVHSSEGHHLSMIVTSLKRLNELGPELNPNASPWYNHYLFLRLKPFSNAEIDEMLRILRIPDLREATGEVTGGHPALLQIAGFLLYRDLLTGNAPSVDVFIQDFEETSQPVFQNIWNRCSEQQQILLILISLFNLKGRLHKERRFDVSGIEFIFSQKERELTRLEEQGIVTPIVNEDKTVYSLTSSVMEKWVIQELWNKDEEWLLGREKVFLNLMSSNQKDKLTNTIKWLWDNKNQVKLILQWFGKLLNLFS